jgi:glucans biosynthesis protein C
VEVGEPQALSVGEPGALSVAASLADRAASSTAVTRLHALDAIRAAALLLGIWLHAGLSFIPGVRPELWPFLDEQKSLALSVTAFVIHAFRMPVFFLVAGLLARQSLQRLGMRGFVRDRARRIALPLVIGWIVCFALIVAVVVAWLMHRNGGVMPSKLPDSLVAMGPNFMHLWFLYVLLWLYALALGARAVMRTVDRQGRIVRMIERGFGALLRFPVGASILALPIAAALLLHPHWLHAEGVPTPGYTLVPPLAPLFIYGCCFAVGWLLDRNRDGLAAVSTRLPSNLLIGFVSLGVCLAIFDRDGVHAPTVAEGKVPLYAYAYSVALVSVTLAFVGLGLRWWGRPRPLIRYVADASYWMYLMHLPLVMALQAVAVNLDTHWLLEFAMINAITIAVLLMSYQGFVRSSWIGALLNGRGKLRTPEANPA